jgi:hypothetical protein
METCEMRRNTFKRTSLSVAVGAILSGSALLGVSAPVASSTTVDVSGYVKVDAIFDLDAKLGDTFAASAIPPSGSVEADRSLHTRFHARQSRVRLRTDTDVGNGRTINTLVEGDFFGAGGNQVFSNSSSFRIRHAMVSFDSAAGSFLVGQYWTNFMDLVAYPSTVDFFGPAGKSFVRSAQFRYTFPSGLAISLENPETSGTGAAGTLNESQGGIGEDELPDLAIAWRGGPGGPGGSYEIAGLLRKIGVNGVAPAGTPLAGTRLDDSETGWGVNLAGAWDVGAVQLMGSVTYGDGIGRYLINGFNNDLFVNADGSIETVESLGLSAAIVVNWTDSSSSTLAWGHFSNDTPARSNGIDEINTLHLNYVWSPYPRTSFGVEAVYGELDNADGTSGDATRLQFGVQYNF